MPAISLSQVLTELKGKQEVRFYAGVDGKSLVMEVTDEQFGFRQQYQTHFGIDEINFTLPDIMAMKLEVVLDELEKRENRT